MAQKAYASHLQLLADQRWQALAEAGARPQRVRPWFPAELQIQRAEALGWAQAAFRKHGVYLSVRLLQMGLLEVVLADLFPPGSAPR